MDEDDRIIFLENNISSILRISQSSDQYNKFHFSILHSKEVISFLDDPSCLVLQVVCSSDDEFHFYTSVRINELKTIEARNDSPHIVFIKRSINSISPKNIESLVDIHSIQASSYLDSLRSIVKNIFVPVILADEQSTNAYPPKVRQLLSDLDLNLTSAQSAVQDSDSWVDAMEVTPSSMELTEEVTRWRALKDNRRSPYYRLAQAIDIEFTKLEEAGLLDLLSVPPSELSYLISLLLDVLHNIWCLCDDDRIYPQSRMEALFSSLGRSFVRYFQGRLSMLDIWSTADEVSQSHVFLQLETMASLCDEWCSVPTQLTKSHWSRVNGGRGIWKGDDFHDTYAEGFLARLEEIMRVLRNHNELCQLLTNEEFRLFKVDKQLAPFTTFNPVLYNPFAQSTWTKAMATYDKSLAPIEQAVGTKLRAHFSKFRQQDKSYLPFLEFQKYKSLLLRPTLRKELVADRENLFTFAQHEVKTIESLAEDAETGGDDDDDQSSTPRLTWHRSPHLTLIVDRVVYLKQLHARLFNIRTSCVGLVNDFAGFAEFDAKCEHLLCGITAREKRIFDAWLRDTQQRIDDDDPLLCLQGSLLSWKDGILAVNYSDELLIFKQEVRQFQDLGFKIPSRNSHKEKSILSRAAEAEKYYKYGLSLQKTANFYNSLSDQIIGVQEELLLESLTAFALLVSKHSGVNTKAFGKLGGIAHSTIKGASNSTPKKNEISWGDHSECEAYVHTLQEAAEKLAAENKVLRKIHEALCEHVVALMGINFLTQTDAWKQRWRLVKETAGRVKSKYPAKDCRQWLLHWDHQVYKALEASYQMGLESLHESLPDIRVDLVLANKKLEFKPTLEQLKLTFYAEIRKFVSMPTTFDGLGNADVYKKMISNNASRLTQVYLKADALFAKVAAIESRYEEWVSIGTVADLDTFVESNVTQQDEYVATFRAVRSKLKLLDKAPDYEKVDCCTVGLFSFKSSVENLYRRVNDTLLISLRRSILEEFREVDSYLDASTARLNTRPQTVQEIGKAKSDWREIENLKNEMKSQSSRCVEKKKLLLQQAPGSGVDVTEVISRMANLDGQGGRWDDFNSALESFDELIEEQKEVLKGSLEEEIAALNTSVERVSNRWRQLKPTEAKSWEPSEVQRVFSDLQDWTRQLDDLQQQADELTKSCLLFAMPTPRFDGLEVLKQDLASTRLVWDLLKQYNEELKSISEQDWLTFAVNMYALQDFAQRWQENLKTFNQAQQQTGATKAGAASEVAVHISDNIDRIKKSVPALKYCQGDSFKEDHWTELLQGKLQLPRDIRRENVRVEHFLSRLHILAEPSMLAFAKNLQSRAVGEVQIREALLEIRAWERSAEVSMLPPEESGRKIPLIKEWKDLLLELGDKQSLLGSLKDSEFFKAFADQGLVLEAKMTSLDIIVHTLNDLQRKWMYLEPIFGRGSLPAEEARFRRVDKEFSDIMLTLARDPKLFTLVDEHQLPQLPARLREMTDQLARCQKALTDFLEAKRAAMPRFYFIGDDDLLEILGQAKNPAVVQSHLKKLFQGIQKVVFSPDNSKIVAMVSSYDEVVELDNPVVVNEKVEIWLECLACEMRATLASMLKRSLNLKNLDWSFPSQVICLTHTIQFTEDAERAIAAGSKELDNLHSRLESLLRKLTSDDLSAKPLLQLKVKSLVFDLVHHIDIVTQLQSHRVSSVQDWKWKKQLRYYLENGKAIVRMHDAKFAYTYEYQGNFPRLVYTPLTDKCFLTLTQGMHMGFGSSLIGPAGTGKTESVKALASCLGRQVLVFNCDEALESASMVRIFMGIVKCGAWGCFDEFNRLKEDQLSAISQQIQIIQDAIKMKTATIQLLGTNVTVDFNSGIFVTLNPAGKNYGGRSRLPDNLKALFRPVAMGVPDNELIAEVSLVSEGFAEAKELASKVVSLFKLAGQLLSSQRHYDWGLRGLKAVLNSAGRLIQQHRKSSNGIIATSLEYELLIKAVRINALPKLTYADTRKFLPLIGDVFPGVQSDDASGGELENAIREVMSEKPFHLVIDDAQAKKMVQLKESLDQRIGCVIVGPPGSGKSTLWQVLKAAMAKCGQKVISHVMNPKSMPRQQLLGRMDPDTREWFDGVLTDAARKVVKESADTRCWIVCDGDVDPEWIESLNSVLDDNHLLTLPNGERISFGSNINFLFETHDLKYASPATVSRMGMIFMSSEDLHVSRLVQRFLISLSVDHRESISEWTEELFYKTLEMLSNYETVVKCSMTGLVFNGFAQLRNCSSRQEFVCALIRGLGGNLSVSTRTAFAKEIFRLANDRPPDSSAPLDCHAVGASYVPIPNSSLTSSDLDDIAIASLGESFAVSTVSLERSICALAPLIANFDPILLIGPAGCGKETIIRRAFAEKRGSHLVTIHCNAQTSATDVISKLSQSCALVSSSEGQVYRPRDSERLVLYFKNINLPRPDKYDSCQLVSFLQQLVSLGGFYSNDLEFLRVERVQIVVSISAGSDVGRHTVSSRLTSILRIVTVDYPETSELIDIYDNYLSVVFNSVPVGESLWLQLSERRRLATAIVEVYHKTKGAFTPDDNRHYQFTLRDVTKWVKGISRYNLASEPLLEVISYECCRVFKDRLVGPDACAKFDQILMSIFRNQLKFSLPIQASSSFFSALKSGGVSVGEVGDAPRGIGRPLVRVTEDELCKSVSEGVVYFEREERDLNLLLFPEILDHISHIDRALSADGGHCLLMGKPGVGQREAATIVAYMLGYELRTLTVCRGYSHKQVINDIKSALVTAGIKGEHCLLLIEDYQITSDTVLEIVNSILSAGEVPGLYTHEELEPLLSPLRDQMREAGGFRTPYEFFVARVKRHLHIVLCMDPGHSAFVSRCESNPALYSHCSNIWMADWNDVTLRTVPLLMEDVCQLLPDDDVPDSGSLVIDDGEGKHSESTTRNDVSTTRISRGVSRSGLIEMMVSIHRSCAAERSATPREYVAFLRLWQSTFTTKREQLQQETAHLEAGLSKLDTAAAVVRDLSESAERQERELRVAQAAADHAMDDISRALTSASDRRIEVAEVKRSVADNEKAALQRKREIEGELSEIQPLLDQAKLAVGSIKSEHLSEIRSLAAPPEAIADVLAAVLMMLGIQDVSWQSMKKFLGNRGVKEEILKYDAAKMTEQTRNNVLKLMKKKPNSFEDAVISRASAAAAPMCTWAKANIKYSLVVEKIQPLQAELNEATRKLIESETRLAVCEDELRDIDVRVGQLRIEFASKTGEAERLKHNLEIASSTLGKAQRLVAQLNDERVRWHQQVESQRQDLVKLPVKMLLAAGFICYLSKAPDDVRAAVMKSWRHITGIDEFDLKRALSTESELLAWKSMGLADDNLSQENGIAITSCSDRFCFVVDPASAATEWLKAVLSTRKDSPLEVVSQHDPRFVNTVELAVRFGKTLLVLDADGVEPFLYPLCRRDLCNQGGRLCVTVGDKLVDYNEKFRLVFCTRNSHPDLPADAVSMVQLVNFTITKSGLEEKLLSLAIQHDQPELEKAKGAMLKKEEDFKVQLAMMEKTLLQSLATAEGNLLENTVLIESLSSTKLASGEISEALRVSTQASVELDRQRDVYRPFAMSGSELYFLVKELATVNHMYQFSLKSFVQLFNATLQIRHNSDDLLEKLKFLRSDLEVATLHYVCRGLFKADRLTFALHLVHRMHPELFQDREWEVFTGSLMSPVAEGSTAPRGFPSWGSTDRIAAFRLLQEQLPSLISALELDNTKWHRFASSAQAERDVPPMRGVTSFQRVLVIQALRPDRLHSALIQFCAELLRVDSIFPPALSLHSLHAESTATSPILLLSSPGADPSRELLEYADSAVGADAYQELAMGGGQLDAVVQLIRRAAETGSWVCLKNLHLVVSWLPALEKELIALNPQKNFRLWLTTESHPAFPPILLQESLKATYESPPGIKKNLQRTFDSWDREKFAQGSAVHKRLLFLLASFHAVLQERRTYIPQGWSKAYEFSVGDIRAGAFVIEAAVSLAKKGAPVDWNAIHGLMEDAIYGGRIDNAFDMQVLRAYLKLFFNDTHVSEKSGGAEILPGTPLRMPSIPEYESFQKIISQLPDTDSPYMLGLPDSVDRSLQRASSAAVTSQLRSLQVVGAEGRGFDKDQWRARLGPVLDLWKQLVGSTAGLINEESARKRDPVNEKTESKTSPVDDLIRMENDIAAKLCSVVDSSLTALRKVLFGSGLLTSQVQELATTLLSGGVPAVWIRDWAGGPESMHTWLRELVRKRIALTRLRGLVEKNRLLEEPMNLGDLFRPSTFVSALRQLTARSTGCPMDQLHLACSWEKDSNTLRKCTHTCTITGLWLQGAAVQSGSGALREPKPDAPDLVPVPAVTIGFVPLADAHNNTNGAYTTSVPVFLTLSREDLLMELPMKVEAALKDVQAGLSIDTQWVLAGTALFLRGED